MLQVTEQVVASQLQHRRRLFAGYTFKPIEEFVNRLPRGDRIKEVFKWHTGTVKAESAADAVRVDPDQAEERMSRLDLVALQELGIDRRDMHERLATG